PGQLRFTQGGDWKGITQKLDYIVDLGVTAIWISPPSKNELFSRDKSESGYHGYFTHDYYSPDPHYGTKEDLIELVNTAHAKGLKVILDVVPNHTADYLLPYATQYDSVDYQPAPPFNNPD
ncbi:MAG TPA: alpha-amylase, partial [Clostridiales bacterium]|nr:alpha-amylase [Clostridiales bacterium]